MNQPKAETINKLIDTAKGICEPVCDMCHESVRMFLSKALIDNVSKSASIRK